jgi:hypothetical protein
LLLSITIKTRACWAEVAFVLTANSGEKQKSRGDKYSEFHYSQALAKAGKAQFTGEKSEIHAMKFAIAPLNPYSISSVFQHNIHSIEINNSYR